MINFLTSLYFLPTRFYPVDNKILPKGVVNKFKEIQMAYYQDKVQTPIFEQTVQLNEQGIASYFKYNYPDYSFGT